MAPKKREKITRLEPEGVELLEAYPKNLQKFRDAGWFNLCTTLQGYHEQVSMMFAQNFDGFATVVGKFLIHVISIGTACRLSVYEERWWKKEDMPMEIVNQFLLLECQNPNWSQGIPQRWMKKE
jgi:hypothetical protein